MNQKINIETGNPLNVFKYLETLDEVCLKESLPLIEAQANRLQSLGHLNTVFYIIYLCENHPRKIIKDFGPSLMNKLQPQYENMYEGFIRAVESGITSWQKK